MMEPQQQHPATQAPIAVFAYRRPEHLRRTLESLMRCVGFEGSLVFVFCDGPRDDTERAAVQATRDVAQALLGERAQYRFSDVNRGLSTSVISGVDAVLALHDRVIVIEDDLALAPGFLDFMNTGLATYAAHDEVFQVSGYMFDAPALAAKGESMFLPFTTSWGWATWRRAWQRFDAAATGWEQVRTDPALRRRFNLDNAYDHATMLERQMAGQRDSWAIRWYWSVFRASGVVLFPPASLVRNTGFDGSGTHGRGVFARFGRSVQPLPDAAPVRLPATTRVDTATFDAVVQALKWQNGGWKTRILDFVRRVSGL